MPGARRRQAPCSRRSWSKPPSFWSFASGSTSRPRRWRKALRKFSPPWAPRAIIVGSVLALRQARLKLLIAYSTVAQIGYLFLIFPLAVGAHPWAASAWVGGSLQAVSHAFAKAAMFLSAGLIAKALGHDRIAEFRGLGRIAAPAVLAFGLGGMSLMGLPPSGGFTAKWLLLTAAIESGQWSGRWSWRRGAPRRRLCLSRDCPGVGARAGSSASDGPTPGSSSGAALALGLALFAVCWVSRRRNSQGFCSSAHRGKEGVRMIGSFFPGLATLAYGPRRSRSPWRRRSSF